MLSRPAAFLCEVDACRRPGLRLHERVLIISTVGVTAGGRGINVGRIEWARCVVTEVVVALTRIAYYRVKIRPTDLDVEEMP